MLKEKPQRIGEDIEKKQIGRPEESIHNVVQRKQETAVGELGDRKTEWEGLTQRERSEHSQGTNNVIDNKSLNQQWKPEYSR